MGSGKVKTGLADIVLIEIAFAVGFSSTKETTGGLARP